MPDPSLPSSRPSPSQIALWRLIAVLSALLILRDYDSFQLGTYGDDATYVVLAKSLADGEGYGLINVPGETPGSPPFPLGFPLLLSLILRRSPGHLGLLRLPSLAATLASTALLFWGWPWFCRRSRLWGLAISGLYALSPLAVGHARGVMSEPLFTLLLLLATLLSERAARHARRAWNALALGCALTALALTRTIGLAVLPVLALYPLARRGRGYWRELAATAGVSFLLVVIALAATRSGPSGLIPPRYFAEWRVLQRIPRTPRVSFSGYTPSAHGEWADVPRRDDAPRPNYFKRRLKRHFLEAPRRAILPLGGGAREESRAKGLGVPFLPLLVDAITSLLLLLGCYRWVKTEGPSAWSLSGIAFYAALLLWNWSSPRLLFPIRPQLFLSFLIGVEAVAARLTEPKWTRSAHYGRRLAPVLVMVVMLALSVYGSYTTADTRLHVGDLSARTRWSSSMGGASDVLMTEEPVLDYLYSEHKTVPFPAECMSDTELWSHIETQGATLLLLAPEVRWQSDHAASYSPALTCLLPALELLEAEGKLAGVYESPEERIRVQSVVREW